MTVHAAIHVLSDHLCRFELTVLAAFLAARLLRDLPTDETLLRA
jgi:hypothetical protein